MTAQSAQKSYLIHLGDDGASGTGGFKVSAQSIQSLIALFECVTEVLDGSCWLAGCGVEFNSENTADVYFQLNDTPVNVLITEIDDNTGCVISSWAAIRDKIVFELNL